MEGGVSVCLRLSTFARVCLRLLAFSSLRLLAFSPLRLLAFVSVCLRLFAFARICLPPPLLRPLCVTLNNLWSNRKLEESVPTLFCSVVSANEAASWLKVLRIVLGGTSAERSWHERFFSGHEFSHEKCSEIFPKLLSLTFVGPKKSRKIPAKFPQNSRQISRQISLPKIKNKSPTSFCRSARRTYCGGKT